MAKLPETARISREDIIDAPDWIDLLLSPINSFFESVYSALNRNLTFSDNFVSQIKEMTFKTLPTYSSGSFTPIEFSHNLRTKPVGLLKLQLYNQADRYGSITDPVDLSWNEQNGIISIKYITGLANSTSYFLRVLVF